MRHYIYATKMRSNGRRKLTPVQAEIARLEKSNLEQSFMTQIKMVGLPEPERE